jgi:hypothetical protein
MGRLAAYALSVAFGLLLLGTAASQAAPSRQALRTCVDRWNQAHMVGWGPNLVNIAIRRLVPAEVHNVGSYGRAPRCVACPDRGPRYRGRCFQGSEYTRDPAALKCVSDVQFEACYAPTGNWNRIGAVVACAGAGSTRFSRFLISRRS